MRKVLIILGQLRDQDVEWMARSGVKHEIANEKILIEQGVRSDNIFILLEGKLRIEDKKLGVIARLGSGEIVGEMSFVDDAPPSATVVADGGCTVLRLSHEAVMRRAQEDPGFGMRIYKALCFFLADRLRGTVRRFGYGTEASLDTDDLLEDELDENLLDNVSLAGERFDRMLKLLATARAS